MEKSYLNWLENTSENCYDTLFPFGKDLYKFSIYHTDKNTCILTSLKVRNADYIYAKSGVFDSYFVPADKIAMILSEIDYNECQVTVGEFNSIKSARRFVNKRIGNYLAEAAPTPLPQEEIDKGHDSVSDSEIFQSSSHAMELLNNHHIEAFEKMENEEDIEEAPQTNEEVTAKNYFNSRLFNLDLDDTSVETIDKIETVSEDKVVEEPKEQIVEEISMDNKENYGFDKVIEKQEDDIASAMLSNIVQANTKEPGKKEADKFVEQVKVEENIQEETAQSEPEEVKEEIEEETTFLNIPAFAAEEKIEEVSQNVVEPVKEEEPKEKVEELPQEEPKPVEEKQEPLDILQKELDDMEFSIEALKPTGVVFGVFDGEEDELL